MTVHFKPVRRMALAIHAHASGLQQLGKKLGEYVYNLPIAGGREISLVLMILMDICVIHS